MLKKITVDQLSLGMYVHRLCGSWLDHPFWKSAFLLTDGRQLAQIKSSAVREAWIDTLKGGDVPAMPDHADRDESPGSPAPESEPAAETRPSALSDEFAACSLSEELARAAKTVAQGRGAMMRMFQDVRLGNAIDTEHCQPLVYEITQSVKRNPGAIVSLARLKTSDDYTYMHSVAVCALMVSLARRLDFSEADTREAGMAGLVHDLGKAAMPLEVLNKPGPLTTEEFAIMKGHPAAGHRMLMEARGVSAGVMDVYLHHHEKFNGKGYPDGLDGERISLLARLGAVCDVYDAITSNRPYKAGWDPALSVQKMAQWSREGHFDETVFQAFVKTIGIYPIGSLVRLSSNRLGVIVDQSPSGLLTPLVMAVFAIETRQYCEPELIDIGEPGCDERIVSRETPEQWGLSGLDDFWREGNAPTPLIAAP